MGTEYRYTMPYIPPSLNKFAGRNNVWEYRTLKTEWERIISAFCRPRPKEPFSKAVVTIEYFFKTKIRHDPDNYSGKLILDGLTRQGIIKDDSFDCIELVLKGNCDSKNPRTEITITEEIK